MNRRNPITIADRIEQSGKTARALAEEAGITEAYLSQIRHGDRRPGLGTLGSLARALGCEPKDLRPDLAKVFG